MIEKTDKPARGEIPPPPGKWTKVAGAALNVAGLFAGIGGLELGLARAGHHSTLLCEIDEPASRVLRAHFPDTPLLGDIRAVKALPRVDILVAGFPCQDLSQAGRTAGIGGTRSSLVREVFRLIGSARPRWLLLENVPFMLRLDKGRAMAYLTRELSERGFNWAYRVVETRAFGLPQRRRRVLLLASRTRDPRSVLFADDVGEPDPLHPFADGNRGVMPRDMACGFYWTEGVRGLGWALDAIPTLKGGSTVGIPSPPAIILPSGEIGTPEIRDAERLQGFPEDWTAPAMERPEQRNGPRWKLVGNAVSVPVATWVGHQLARPGKYRANDDRPHGAGNPWPTAAWSMRGGPVHVARVSPWPEHRACPHLAEFLYHPMKPLSLRASAGFRARTEKSTLRFPPRFLDAVDAHIERMRAPDRAPHHLAAQVEHGHKQEGELRHPTEQWVRVLAVPDRDAV